MNILIITRWYPKDKNDISGIFVKEQAELISTRHRVSLFHVGIDYHSFGLLNKFQISNKQVNNNISITRLIFSKSFPIFNQVNFIFGAYYKIWRE